MGDSEDEPFASDSDEEQTETPWRKLMPNQMLQGMVAGCAMELVICTLCVITFGNVTGFSEYLQSSSEVSAISEASSEVSRQYGRTASIVCAVTNLVRLLLVVRIVYLPENLFNAQLWDKRIFIQLLLSSYLIAFVGYAFLLNSAVITDCSISSAPKSIYTHTEGWGKFAEGWGKIAAYNETFVDCHIGCNSTLLGHIPNADQIPALALFTCLFRFGPPLIFGFLFIKGVLLYGELETMKSVKVLFQLALLDVADVAAFSTINFEAPGHIFFEHNKKIVFNLMRVFLVCCGCTVCLEVFSGIMVPHYQYPRQFSLATLTKVTKCASLLGTNVPLLLFRLYLFSCGVVVDKVYLLKNMLFVTYEVSSFLGFTMVTNNLESMVGMMPGSREVELAQEKHKREVLENEMLEF